MAPEERLEWLTSVLGPLDVADAGGGFLIGVSTDVPAAVSVGFSDVDSGLIVDGPDADSEHPTDVRCEIICAASGASPEQRAIAVARAWHALVDTNTPAQPETFLPGLVDDPALAIHHGLLREPQIFDRGTPMVTEPDRMTLLLELVLLTDGEYSIAAEQGLDVLERRLRRRSTDLGDWNRD